MHLADCPASVDDDADCWCDEIEQDYDEEDAAELRGDYK